MKAKYLLEETGITILVKRSHVGFFRKRYEYITCSGQACRPVEGAATFLELQVAEGKVYSLRRIGEWK